MTADSTTGARATPWSGVPGADAEERVGGKTSYLAVLKRLHRRLQPVEYLEIGVRHGRSLALARGAATGVDPAPEIARRLSAGTRVVREPSDTFFDGAGPTSSPDLCFIDGLHLFEQTLRDFMNVERRAAAGAIVAIDDVLPNHPAQAERGRRTRVWTGDVWRIVDVLRDYRPDLFRLVLDTKPTGMLLVAGLDPQNRVLWDNYEAITRGSDVAPRPPQSVLQRHDAIDPSDRQFDRVVKAMADLRRAGAGPRETVSALRKLQSEASLRGRKGAATPRLSVIVVGYNMRRELPRTIRSLSAEMQRGVDPSDYEVILIDNGSTDPFDEAELRRFIPDLVVRRVPNATVSPAPAINLGLGLARGDLVGVCIDGARMASPGLLAAALAASQLHPRPMIGAISFHLGPAVQMKSAKRGYDQAREDALLARSRWEADGYRLFGVASFAGSSSRGWFELPTESNALFLRAEHWRALGGYDERFAAPGGGYANLDMWRRICADLSGELIMLLGEATFHQIHGGVATNSASPPIAMFQEEYERIRGRPYERPARAPLFFGSLPDAVQASLRRSWRGSSGLRDLRRRAVILRNALRGRRNWPGRRRAAKTQDPTLPGGRLG